MSPYGSAVINNTNPGNVVTITTCQWGGEYASLAFNVTGVFTFSSTVATDYFTLTNASSSVVAFGSNPLTVTISLTGNYYLHTAASGPPACSTQNTCRITRVIVPIPPCSGTPNTGTIATSQALICPNTSATLSLPGSSAGTGMFYQWYASSSDSVGPFVLIPGATAPNYSTSPAFSVTTWYQAVLICTNSASSSTSAPIAVNVAATTTNTIPYNEGFEGTIVNNQLPNCSWKASNMPVTCQTYVSPGTMNRVPRTGNKFASFYYLPASSSYFYTNGLKLEAGVTYSASVWYTTEHLGYTNWTNLSMMLGPNQSTTGLNTIASTNGVAASPNYKSLSNTFTVASSGIYYLAIKASSSGACCAQYLSFDDIDVNIPCALNTPVVSFNASADTICEGENVNMYVFGGDTYLWSTGATSSSVTVNPFISTGYTVLTTNSVTGCSMLNTHYVEVWPVDPIIVYSASLQICPGQPTTLFAFGAVTYSWSNGSNNPQTTVNPMVSTSYSVIGANSYGCTNQSALTITVNPLPTITASSSRTLICEGETVMLSAQGGVNYQWQTGSTIYLGNQIIVSPQLTAIYTVTGYNNAGCANTSAIVQNVTPCSMIEDKTKTEIHTRVFPNPNQGKFQLVFEDEESRTVEVTDMYSKLVFRDHVTVKELTIDLNGFANGLFFIRITGSQKTETSKVIKN